jgi:hypothetical protein
MGYNKEDYNGILECLLEDPSIKSRDVLNLIIIAENRVRLNPKFTRNDKNNQVLVELCGWEMKDWR